MIEMELTGVRVELPTNQPIVLLRERGGERYLPIWIGAAEAAAIALCLQGVVTPRPMTHDLMKSILEDLAIQVERIVVTELRESTFFASIELKQGAANYEISSRPSDAIALGGPHLHTDLRERRGPRGGGDLDPGRRGRGGREVPRVPRQRHARGLRSLSPGSRRPMSRGAISRRRRRSPRASR